MCLAVPGKIVETQTVRSNRLGLVQFGGTRRPVFLDLVPEANIGDYVLVHVGFAISKVDEEEAGKTFEALKAMSQLEELEWMGEVADRSLEGLQGSGA